MLLPLHVVGFFTRHRAELAPQHETPPAGSLTWMCTRTLCCSPATTRLPPSGRELFAQAATVDALARDDAFRAVTVFEVVPVARRYFRSRSLSTGEVAA